MTMYGFDTANYQRGINMQAMKNAGAEFVIIKANEGTGTYYDTFNEQITAAHSAGLLLGAYSFLREGDGRSQAQAFVQSLGAWAKKIRLYADWEFFLPNQPSAADVQTLHDFLAEVKRLTGTTCGAYTSGSYKAAAGSIGDSDWWLAGGASYGQTLGFNWSGEYMGATIHQYTSGGGVPAWNADLDLNLSVIPKENWYESVGDKSLSSGEYSPSQTNQTSGAYSFAGKSLEQMANDVQDGSAGSGDERKTNLGYFYTGVQAIVNHRYGAAADQVVNTLADETLSGKYGNGDLRKVMLGSYYNSVQDVINGVAAAPTAQYYTVVSGDTLSGIGSKLGVNWQDLANANGVAEPYTIYPGQQLKY